MKLSDKILLGFFGVIFIYMTAAFVEVRVTGTPNTIDETNSAAEGVDIPVLSYIVLNDLHNDINITGSDRNRLEVRSLSGESMKDLKYEMSGDTLKLSPGNSPIDGPVRIMVFVSSSLKGISVNTSDAVLRNVQQEQLHVLQNSGHVWISESSIGRMDVDLSNGSNLDISGLDLDTLSVNLKQSNANIHSSVGVLRGLLKNDSFLFVDELEDIQLKKDKTSRLSTN